MVCLCAKMVIRSEFTGEIKMQESRGLCCIVGCISFGSLYISEAEFLRFGDSHELLQTLTPMPKGQCT